jgi:hypothetical protein
MEPLQVGGMVPLVALDMETIPHIHLQSYLTQANWPVSSLLILNVVATIVPLFLKRGPYSCGDGPMLVK